MSQSRKETYTYLDFISDEHFFACLEKLYKAYEKTKEEMTLKKFYSNKIDGIKLIFDNNFHGLSEKESISMEIQRQIDKTISNAIGHFHQELLGGLDGLESFPVGKGYDLKSRDNKIFVEVKNKHNTMNADSKKSVFKKLKAFAEKNKDATAYLVEIISNKSRDEPWALKGQKEHPRVRIISVDRFYDKVTNVPNAFKQVCDVLPRVIKDFLERKKSEEISGSENTKVFEELKTRADEQGRDIFTQILYDNFQKYKGFSSHRQYKFLDVFSGAGGLALGLEMAGFNCVGAVEIDKDCCKTLRKNRPHWNVVECDVERVDSQVFDSEGIDLLSASIPCPTFSIAHKELDKRYKTDLLFAALIELLSTVKPKMFLAESCAGIVMYKKEKLFKKIITMFIKAGYKVQHNILNAKHYGVAHRRKRVIIVGTREDIDIDFVYPTPSEHVITIKNVLEEVPSSSGITYGKQLEEIFRLIPPGGSGRDLPGYNKQQKYGKLLLRRASWDLPCPPLMVGSKMICHPDEVRPFTVRECARIQSFPDSWEFEGNKGSQYRQIVGAFPVKFAQQIGKAIFDALSRNKV